MQKLKNIAIALSTILIVACSSNSSSSNNTTSIEVDTGTNGTTYIVSQLNESSTTTYTINVYSSTMTANVETVTISTSGLSAPFSVTQNTCNNVAYNHDCNITITYHPTLDTELFASQTLVLTTGNTSKLIPIKGVPNEISTVTNHFSSVRTGIHIKTGDSNKTANVMVDTGSSMLVLKEKYLADYTKTSIKIKLSYGEGSDVVLGDLVYSDVHFDTKPVITATQVPIVMVSNNTPSSIFSGADGILGLEMNNQLSTRLHLPYPFNQMIIINGTDLKLTFGDLTDSQSEEYAYYQLKKGNCINNTTPLSPYDEITCWATRQIPVDYTIKDNSNSTICSGKMDSIFDSGGNDTNFEFNPIPGCLSDHISDGKLQGTISSAKLETNNAGNIDIPTTNTVKVTNSISDSKVNSGYKLFYEKTVLFDQKNGIVGIK